MIEILNKIDKEHSSISQIAYTLNEEYNIVLPLNEKDWEKLISEIKNKRPDLIEDICSDMVDLIERSREDD